MLNHYLKISPEVSQALTEGKPIVALESTIIAHGMPYPKMLKLHLPSKILSEKMELSLLLLQSLMENYVQDFRKKKLDTSVS